MASGRGLPCVYGVVMATNPKHKPTVCVSWISPGEVRHEFVESIMSMNLYFSERGRKVVRAFVGLQSGPRIAEARSKVVEAFAETRAEWLLMIDSDMVWEADALDKLLETADPVDAPIVGGLCFGGRADKPMFPTIYSVVADDDGNFHGVNSVIEYPKDSVIKVGATGAAFLLVHRDVFVKMRKAFGKLPGGEPNPYPWFVEASNGGKPYGEDISFCIRALALDIPIYVDTRVKIGHIKTRVLSESAYEEQQSSIVKQVTTPELVLPDLG